MKLVFVCFYEAYPPTSGAASVSYNVAKYAEGERYLLQLGAQDREELTSDNVSVITFRGDSNRRIEKIYKLPRFLQRIVGTIKKLSPEIVILEGASWVMYHWLLLRKIRNTCPNIRIVYHSHNVEYLLRKEKHSRLIAELTRWAEGRILRNADMSFAVSEVDRQHFEKLYGISPEILPNGVDLDKFELVTDTDINNLRNAYGLNERTILFMGSYSYRPNREAIDLLIKSVMPKVIQSCPDAQIAIIGDKVPYKEKWLINPGCIPHEEISVFTRACQVGVAPIFSGSGTRLKILEYMAAGIPVVATAKGGEGLSIQNRRDVVIAEEEHFAGEVVNLFVNGDLAVSLGKNGREVVRSHYSWESIMQHFNDVLNSRERNCSDGTCQ